MKTFFTLLLAALCAATSYGQTMKALSYNTSNNQVVTGIGTNRLTFTNNTAAPRLNTTSGGSYSNPAITIGATNTGFVSSSGILFAISKGSPVFSADTNEFSILSPMNFGDFSGHARTNLGLGLRALTNTSNVTTMRALAGSTNTNQPFSGYFEYSDGTDTYGLTFSNGILLQQTGPL
jgi:hypothetical protein